MTSNVASYISLLKQLKNKHSLIVVMDAVAINEALYIQAVLRRRAEARAYYKEHRAEILEKARNKYLQKKLSNLTSHTFNLLEKK